jgi:hypothetical protein
MTTEMQAVWTFINVVGWPSAILFGYFRGIWISGRQATEQCRQLEDHYKDAIVQRDNRFKLMDDLWRERLAEKGQQLAEERTATAEWRDAFFGSVQIAERGVSAAERVVAISPKAND